MLVRERMKALGDHAKSSRQPPVKERQYAKADESAAKQDTIDETILESGAEHESAVALLDDVTPQIGVHKSGNDGAAAEITPEEEAAVLATVAAVVAKIEPQPSAADDSTTHARSIQEDDNIGAAKRAIIHEWQNWSALHSDELGDSKVAEYFFQHLQNKKPQLLKFASKDDDHSEAVQKWIFRKTPD